MPSLGVAFYHGMSLRESGRTTKYPCGRLTQNPVYYDKAQGFLEGPHKMLPLNVCHNKTIVCLYAILGHRVVKLSRGLSLI